jgi:hypothetical protein
VANLPICCPPIGCIATPLSRWTAGRTRDNAPYKAYP